MISIITPTLNAEKFIAKSVESFLKQDVKEKYEIIVVDSSSDRTPEILAKYPVKLIRQGRLGPATARNLGVKKAKGEIVVFVDADCIAPKNWLRKLVNPFLNKKVAAVSGAYKIWNKESPVAKFLQYEIDQRYEGMKRAGNIDFVGSYNCAYRKKIFAEFGGFDEKMIQAEDPELSFRVSKKYKIVFQPDAFVYHRHATSLLSFARQKFQRAYWKIFLYKIHKKKTLRNVYTPAGLMPQTLLFGASITLLMLAFFNIKFLYISIFLMSLSYVLNLRLLAYIKRKNSKMFLFAVALIFLRNLSASLGLVWGAKYLLKNAV